MHVVLMYSLSLTSSTMFNSHSFISPTSGHIQGGTRVTIAGTDLGVTVDDVVDVLFGNSPCVLQRQLYVPGITFTLQHFNDTQ